MKDLFKFGLALEAGLALAALGLARWALELPLPLRAEPRDWLLGAAAAAPPVLFAVFASSAAGLRLKPLRGVLDALRDSLGGELPGWGTGRILLLSAAAGLAEELMFRGVLQGWAGLWAASLLFGLAHALTPAYFVIAAAMGLYLGALYAATGTLLVPVLVHGLYDAAALALYRGRFRQEEVLGQPGRGAGASSSPK